MKSFCAILIAVLIGGDIGCMLGATEEEDVLVYNRVGNISEILGQNTPTPISSRIVSTSTAHPKPDFILNCLAGAIMNLGDIYGYKPSDFTIRSKDYYWNTPRTKVILKNDFGITSYKDYEQKYNQALKLYRLAEQSQTSFDHGAESTVMDSPDARKYHMKIKQDPEAIYVGTSPKNSTLSPKEAAIAKGIKKSDGSIDFNFYKGLSDAEFNKRYVLKSYPDGSPVLDEHGYGEFKERRVQ
jgi:hypothetical protein